ncbi:LLM class flavin-dependent oxidoreductase [Rhizobacter sp. LjRoot28]|uniref:LLM class flavin-dependent oxidoreductase n=1 Tax=Rhizobacter sp. LjRoot28 TaxID=3342309 RepID=UPI003ECDD127
MKIPLSVLDLVPVGTGGSAAESVRRAVDLARLADDLGYERLWFAEHHGMPAVASAAPEVLIAHVAAHTRRLRIGSGGVMLPNHAPLRVAEAFRTLSALHPGRIDLGLGRAPGSDAQATRALRAFDGEQFPALLGELLTWSGERPLPDGHPMARLKAMPDDAPLPPIWLLGSSGASAEMAAEAGMGYSFASHFSPTPAAPAFEAYRRAFVPSRQFPEPHTILGVSVVCAPTAEEADYLASSMDLAWLRIRSGRFSPLPFPDEARAYPYTPDERRVVASYRALALIGTPDEVAEQLLARARDCGASEVMVVSNLPDQTARLRGYRLLAEALA